MKAYKAHEGILIRVIMALAAGSLAGRTFYRDAGASSAF